MVSIQIAMVAVIFLAYGALDSNANPGDCDIKKCPPEYPQLAEKLCECYTTSDCFIACPEGKSAVDFETGLFCTCVDNDKLSK
ncbi:hypothetical protein DdX_16543 [Ditylenchus destructor]|uniref:Uncharacterized protein n=1 Tax=Ditylenchus destructor TaxID=166010 RepID=A0AAD4MN97_9BILA|nr:hypothetical protein DdX_16543 [Ditylenchus destructor]